MQSGNCALCPEEIPILQGKRQRNKVQNLSNCLKPMSDYQTDLVKTFHLKAGQLAPDKPTIPSLEVRILRAKLILEEAFETIEDGLGLGIWADDLDGRLRFKDLEFYAQETPNLVKICDGCADLRVVVVGTEIACGIDGEAAFREVMRSNMSKYYWTPDELQKARLDGCTVVKLDDGTHCVTNEYGKVLKPAGYSPAQLEQFCKE